MAEENPKHIQAMKDGKAPLEYLITSIEDDDAWVLKGGADKYGVRNWTIDKILASTYEGAIRRHFKEWSEGRDIDPDSGKHHFHHIRACCGIVLDADKKGMLIDDRDRAESISAQKKEDKETNTWVVRYISTHTSGPSCSAPVVRTKCYGPFGSFVAAKKFVKDNKLSGKIAGTASINIVSSI